MFGLLQEYHGSFGYGKPHPEIQRAQGRLDAMPRQQGNAITPEADTTPVVLATWDICSEIEQRQASAR